MINFCTTSASRDIMKLRPRASNISSFNPSTCSTVKPDWAPKLISDHCSSVKLSTRVISKAASCSIVKPAKALMGISAKLSDVKAAMTSIDRSLTPWTSNSEKSTITISPSFSVEPSFLIPNSSRIIHCSVVKLTLASSESLVMASGATLKPLSASGVSLLSC